MLKSSNEHPIWSNCEFIGPSPTGNSWQEYLSAADELGRYEHLVISSRVTKLPPNSKYQVFVPVCRISIEPSIK